MGRSVLALSDATAVAYSTFGPDEEYYREVFDEDIKNGLEDEDFDSYMWDQWTDGSSQDDWHFYVEGVQSRVKELFPSFEDADYWIDNEIRVIAENAHSIVTISEYCGAVAICLAPKYDRGDFWMDDSELSGLGEYWRKKISEKFEREFGSMTKIGTFSNGESVYQMVS